MRSVLVAIILALAFIVSAVAQPGRSTGTCHDRGGGTSRCRDSAAPEPVDQQGGGGTNQFVCQQGEFLTPWNTCVRTGSIYCGERRYCDAGTQCVLGGGCIPARASLCGRGYCRSGLRCASDLRCIPVGYADCGNGISCEPGYKCASGRSCIPVTANDCGNGSYCASGFTCNRFDTQQCEPPGRPPAYTYEERRQEVADRIGQLRYANEVAARTSRVVTDPRTGVPQPANILWDNRGLVDDIVSIIASQWRVVLLPGGSIGVIRDRFNSDLRHLMDDVVQQLGELMIKDVDVILGFDWNDSQAERAVRDSLLDQTRREIRKLVSDASVHVRAPSTYRYDFGFYHYAPNSALTELTALAENPVWLDTCRQRQACNR